MTRQATPDLLGLAPAPAPVYDLAAAMTAAPEVDLYFDYASLGATGAAIRDHAIAIKLCGRRRAEATVEAGEHLLAVKETIPHGQWEPWLRQELGMDERTGQNMMAMARRFGSKAKLISLLSPTVLGLLAPPSVPDAAVDAAIAAAEVSPVTVTAARAIIAAHRPARCRKCGRTLTDPDAIRAGIGACCAARLTRAAVVGEAKADAPPLPEWAQEPEDHRPYPEVFAELREKFGHHFNGETHADPRADVLERLALRLSDLVGVVRELGQSYGEVTGDFTTPLEVKHLLEKMQVKVQANKANGGWD
jgi:hypothetical protein